MGNYRVIADYFQLLREKHNVQVCIKDFTGFIQINKELDEALRPFLGHTNPYCMYVKQSRLRNGACLSLIKRMRDKCERVKGCSFGVCHAGLGEYLIPITFGGLLHGSINVGFFQTDAARCEGLARQCGAKVGDPVDPDVAMRLYRKHIRPVTVDADELVANMLVIADYLGSTCQSLQSAHPSDAAKNLRAHYKSGEDSIIAHCVEYIRSYYGKAITVGDLADFCHCSQSHLSHIFKRRIGVNINTYINKTRVEISKSYLISTGGSICEIALDVGFNDPNYYSRVFAELIGYSPTEFRRRYSEKAKGT
jgi:AraC-like DNA-binding protein